MSAGESIVWLDWSRVPFEQAASAQKPVLLSLVTTWSDACAEMDRSTYAHPDIVALVQDRFIPVRVDADRRPDINERYNLGAWPTTAFLTSTGDVLSGGTFFDAASLQPVLRQVADASRDRADEIAARAATVRQAFAERQGLTDRRRAQPDREAIERLRRLVIERFDRVNGGFGSSPKLPHAAALQFALSLAGEGDVELAEIARAALDRTWSLWDPESGGVRRYADGADWSAPGVEKRLEDNAALLHVHVEAALQLRNDEYRDRAGAIARWTRSVMTDHDHGGFFNASSPRVLDRTMYVDGNAMMAGALLRAAALFDDVWLRDSALKALEAVVVPAYKPGDGMAHVMAGSDEAPVRGLLGDQIHVALALIWAHAATGRLPYSMLAAEVLQFAARTMWDQTAGCFRDRVETDDPVWPFELNCHAACAFDRLAVLVDDRAHQDRAHAILRSLAREYPEQDLFGSLYAVAVREVLDRRPPAGLELSAVDWNLG